MKMDWKMIKNISLWIFLNCLIVMCMDLALFTQTTFKEGEASIYKKVLTSEFWATMEWLFVIPSQRIGYTFLNPAQMNLSSFVFNFLGQIITNNFWLKIPTTLDDYAGMVIILLGMIISKLRLVG